jgi:ATP-binding cassette, subfamily B (MDR/TAP), member 1
VSIVGFEHVGERMVRKMKVHYMQSALKQNMALFDEQGTGDIITQLTSDMNMIQEGISHKLANAIKALGVLVSAYVISFVLYWKLTLILLWAVVFAVFQMFAGRKIAPRFAGRSGKATLPVAQWRRRLLDLSRIPLPWECKMTS